MADDLKKTTTPRPKDVAGRLIVKLLMPLVATAASAAAGYAVKKAPELLEEHIGPRLRGAKDDAADLPGRAKAAAGSAGDLATGLTDRARAVAGGAVQWGDDGDAGENGGTDGVQARSQEELTRRRAERAERRNDRRRNRPRT